MKITAMYKTKQGEREGEIIVSGYCHFGDMTYEAWMLGYVGEGHTIEIAIQDLLNNLPYNLD